MLELDKACQLSLKFGNSWENESLQHITTKNDSDRKPKSMIEAAYVDESITLFFKFYTRWRCAAQLKKKERQNRNHNKENDLVRKSRLSSFIIHTKPYFYEKII